MDVFLTYLFFQGSRSTLIKEGEKMEGEQLAVEPSRDDRERIRHIKKQNCFKNFEITWNYKGYRNARPLVRILTPNHQL